MVSGIIIPGAQEQITGTVIGIGPGKLLDNGDYAPIELTYGDHVMLGKYGNDLISVDGQEFYIVSRETILAIIN